MTKKTDIPRFLEYEGWNSVETWLVSLWLSGDSSLYAMVYNELIPESDGDLNVLARSLKGWWENYIEENLTEQTGPLRDLVETASKNVDWYEIAESWIGAYTMV